MVDINQLTRFLNKELKIKSIKDDSRNGLQVKAKKTIRKIALGVDACLELFQKAKQKKCDFIIVHHGLFWKGRKDILNLRKRRVAFLRENKISLYACHLPLDRHPKLGNNVCLAELIGIKNCKSFARYNRKNIGFYGRLKTNVHDLIWKLEHSLKTECITQLFGPRITKKVGIISGSAAEHMYDCKKMGIDTYVTGEPRHSFYHVAQELQLNVIYLGHYKTETLGVKAIGELLKQKFNIDSVFIDIPTGL